MITTKENGFAGKIFRRFDIVLYFFYAYSLVFPSLRVWIVGKEKFNGWLDFLFTESPSLLTIAIACLAVFVLIKKRNGNKITWLDWAFGGFFIVSLLWGGFRSGNWFIFLSGARMTFIPMLFYVVGKALPIITKGKGEAVYIGIDKIMDGTFFLFLLLAVVGLILYFVFPGLENELTTYISNTQPYFIPRMTSLIWQPVIFGFIMSLTGAYYLFKILRDGNIKYYLYICIISAALLLSVCRGGIISFFIGGAMLALFFRHRWKRLLISLSLILIVVLGISFIMTGNFEITKWVLTSSGDTFQMKGNVTRVQLWMEALNNIKQNPEGYGIGKAGWTAHQYLLNSSDASPYSTDGWYLKTACEIGVVGLGAYIILTVAYLFYMFKITWRNHFTIITYALVALVIIHAQNMVSNVIDFYPYITVYWLLLGLSQGIDWMAQSNNPSLKQS